MPQDLAALLVDEGAVSKADMDRALACQSQQGDALDTALLELELIGEAALLAFLSTASGLPAAPDAAFKEVDPRARRVFPAKVAERHRLAPFALDGRELSVVACHPVDAAVIDEIGFMLSLTLVPYVGVEWRVHDLIHRLYGGPLPARLAKLADTSLVRPEPRPAPSAPPPSPAPAPAPAPAAASAKPRGRPRAEERGPGALSIEEAFFAAGETGAFAPTPPPVAPPSPVAAPPPPPPSAAPAPVEAAVERVTPPPPEAPSADDETSFADIEPERPKPTGFGGDASGPAEPLLAALEQAVDLYDALWADKAPAVVPATSATEPVAPVEAAEPSSAPQAAQEEAVATVPTTEEAVATEPPEEAEGPEEAEEPPGELDRSAPPRWSIDDARTALAAARHRDEVVLVALRFTRDFFEYSALFAVTRDAVVGHDALGPQEDERSHCRGTAIYASDPGIVRTVLETRAPYLGPVSRDAVGTGNILDGLWRGTPRTVLLYPILVSDRPVAVLYADNGEAPVSARRLGDLLLFLSTVGGFFERIIRARKKRRKRTPAAPAAPAPTAEVEPPVPDPAPDWMAPPPVADGSASDLAPVVAPASPPEPEPAPPPPVVEAAPPEPPPAPPEPIDPPSAPEPATEPPPAPAQESPVDAAIATLVSGAPGVSDRVAPIIDLVLGDDSEVAAAARAALVAHRGEAAVKPVPERLRRALLSEVGDRPVLAARALGALRDVESIPILIQALEGGFPGAAAGALAEITLQRLGPSPQKWLKWWKENRGRTRAEWLFAALNAPELELRAAASGELRAAAEPPVRYAPDMPSAEREAAARAWWVWWSRQGVSV